MKRSLPFVVAALVVAAVAVPIAGVAAVDGPASVSDDAATQTEANSTDGNATVAPGERMAGVVGVQQAEVEGEIDRRSFGLRIASTASAESRASVVAGQFADVEERLGALEARKAALAEARENGSMSEGRYRAQVAILNARIESASVLANETAEVSADIPDAALAAKGVNVSAIQTLRQRASELGGPEVAAIARGIAGPPEDRGRDDRSDRRGGNGNRSDGSAGPGDSVTDGDAPDVVDNATDAVANETGDAAENATDAVENATTAVDSGTDGTVVSGDATAGSDGNASVGNTTDADEADEADGDDGDIVDATSDTNTTATADGSVDTATDSTNTTTETATDTDTTTETNTTTTSDTSGDTTATATTNTTATDDSL